jgi:hypothetical protein
MNAREERGPIIAALCKLNKVGDDWLVPSQSGATLLPTIRSSALMAARARCSLGQFISADSAWPMDSRLLRQLGNLARRQGSVVH